MRSLYRAIRRDRRFVALSRLLATLRHRTTRTAAFDMVGAFPQFAPNSTGDYGACAVLTVEAIEQSFAALAELAAGLGGTPAALVDIRACVADEEDRQAADALKRHLDLEGSDKASHHNYHFLYGPILKDRNAIRAVFEIGLGSNNLDVVSHMGPQGRPGASLRAFRDFLPGATVYGADIDRRILFGEDRIRTFFVDQTRPETFRDLAGQLPDALDLVIDDGLHAPHANLRSLAFGLAKVKVGGWVVIEDIGVEAAPLWLALARLLPGTVRGTLFRADYGLVFAVERLA